MQKKILFIAFLICSVIGNAQTNKTFQYKFAPQEGLVKKVEKLFRDEICLNGKWQFQPVTIKKGSTFEEIKSPEKPSVLAWEKTPIKIPSPWNVNGFTNGTGGDFKAFLSYPKAWEKEKAGWLRKTIKVPSDWDGNRIILHFEAVAGYAKVFVNGNVVGDHFDAFLPFNFDITEHAKAGQELEVLVWVAHGKLLNDPGKYGRRNYVAGSFWGIYIAGIWQDVYLQKKPAVYVSDTYVKPWVEKDELELEVTVTNTSKKAKKVNLVADVYEWINKAGKSVIETPEVKWELGKKKELSFELKKQSVPANSSKIFTISTKVGGKLKTWTPDSPNLYGLTVSLNKKKTQIDLDYTRFGWRQFNIKGTEFQLNGKAFEVRGDSWHFMGVPQMTRRYAYAWFQMLKDSNANGVRLHAQVYPRFYLEMADEMGICILDETAIWSSDGGPKIDSEQYWEACREHVKNMVLRDRNYASVMGWSVCNETLPVTKHVFHAPQKLIDRNVEEINKWVAITRKYDPTRTWISGDGETQAKTDLPTVIGHYGGKNAMKDWSTQGKPWGIGETGMAYYGTPSQVAKVNGARAYESQLGRMEGLAGEAFDNISMQRNLNASYVSIFNLAWYGLRPLGLGLKDITKAPTDSDGIFFQKYVEGVPGYQPERLGPYTTTFNPGYDANLPLYESWPLLEAVKAAFADDYKSKENIWGKETSGKVKVGKAAAKNNIVWLTSKENSKLKASFEDLAVLFGELSTTGEQLIFIEGNHPPKTTKKLLKKLKKAAEKGSTILLWGATEKSKELVEALSTGAISFHKRNATSYIIKKEHSIVNDESSESFYFSELTKKTVSTVAIGGEWMKKAELILEACNTDWHKWNYQGEDVKTAKVYRSEREAKPAGNVIARQKIGKGEVIVSTVDYFVLGSQLKGNIRGIIDNLGGEFKGKTKDLPPALNKDYVLENALYLGAIRNKIGGIENVFRNDPISEKEFTEVKIGTKTENMYWDVASAQEKGIWDFMKMRPRIKRDAVVYLSFWMYSPRSLTDLLIEPNMPRLDMHFGMDDALALSVNGKVVKEWPHKGGLVEDQYKYEGVPLEKGWNHVLIKVGQAGGGWSTKVRFSSTKPEFMKKIKSAVVR